PAGLPDITAHLVGSRWSRLAVPSCPAVLPAVTLNNQAAAPPQRSEGEPYGQLMWSKVARFCEVAEAVLRLLAVFVIGFAPAVTLVVGALFGGIENREWLLAAGGGVGGLVTGLLALWLARTAQHAFYACYPAWARLDTQQLTASGMPVWNPFGV